MKSEFGRGVVVCLAKFSEHMSDDMARAVTEAIAGKPTLPISLSSTIELWANGASDHFYELDRKMAGPRLIQLADLMLRIGHGFTGEKWGPPTWRQIHTLWQEACLEVDTKLGVDAEWGTW